MTANENVGVSVSGGSVNASVNAEETRVAIALHGGAGTIERARMTSEQELSIP